MVSRPPGGKPLFSMALVVCFASFCQGRLAAQASDDELFSALEFRHIGPPGNRTSAVVGVPGDPHTYYVGAASGGVWKSIDGGINWKPVFDDQPAQSIGALAVAPSDPQIVWAGTGEAFIRSNVSIGDGVYKSTDGGTHWTCMGLKESGRIGRVVIDPHDPDTVFVAALGHCYGPQKERGVFRTQDGGRSWEQVLFADENTGCFEIAMNPANPRQLFAGMWPLTIRTWGRESGGPLGGLYMSLDGGDTWEHLKGRGLPEAPIGKVGITISHSNPDVVYAIMETGAPNRGVLWRTNDAGQSWKCVSHDRILNERPHYASRIMVNPGDENEIYFAANSHSISYDGGVTTEVTRWSGDTHDMWSDPLDPDRLVLSDDGGVKISVNRGKTWHRIVLPIAQMYHVAVDNQVPYYVYGGKQDGPAYRGPSTTSQGVGSGGEWDRTAGGECGFIVPKPDDPNIVWGGLYNAGFTRMDYRTGHEHSVMAWPESGYGSSADLVKYRFNWTFPIVVSPHDTKTVYVGSQFVHVTRDEGHSWSVISPDLSLNDTSKLGPSGGLTKDNIGVEFACCVFALAESPLEQGVLWAGTNDGLVHITRNGGETWTNLTDNLPELLPWGTISNIEPSKHDKGTCYLSVDYHQMNNRDPFIYKTNDYGASWTRIDRDIPKSVFSYVHWVHEDPTRPGLLYAGTENALYVTWDDGAHWTPLQNNLPHAPVHHVLVQEHFSDLVVATYGRGFWIMDDVTPIQQWDLALAEKSLHLFQPRFAYRWHHRKGGPRVRQHAHIHYYLGEAVEDAVQVQIFDDQEQLVVSLEGKGEKGVNRVTWDGRYSGSEPAKLRTRPPGNPRVVEEKRFRDTWIREGWYPILSWGAGGGFQGILAPPDTYRVLITCGDHSAETQLEIRRDPNSIHSQQDIEALFALQMELREDLNGVSEILSAIERIKAQGQQLIQSFEQGSPTLASVWVEKALQEFQDFQDTIFQKIQAEGDSKSFRFPNLLYSKLSYLASDLNAMGDRRPNQQQRDVHTKLKEEAIAAAKTYQSLIDETLIPLNEQLNGSGIEGIRVPPLKAAQ